ncbi:MAG: beta-ketoacyl-[acyl-carrier-protein] synthase family protein [Thermoguttaceae bacterium]|nr:beta-ketoacyl-[acyl-carrier-protein] synthase family protein [Thermoguttaceae bacterium]MDW8077577.1 beta-ketoacyl synthase N-terminal-like domain-containing protein [Thermoguttaceae bacterium]
MWQAGSESRDVVITGVGVVCPLGLTAEELWTGLTEGRYGIGPFSLLGENSGRLPSAAEPLRIAAPVRQFTGSLDNFGPPPAEIAKSLRKGLKLMCRESQMAVAAALRALSDAGWQPDLFPSDRCGVVFGCDYLLTTPEEFIAAVRACTEDGAFRFALWGEKGLSQMTPLWLLKYLPNMPASHIAIYCQFCGPSNSITLREAGGLVGIAEAARIIAAGHADLMVVGATGSRLHPMKIIHALTQEQVVAGGEPATSCRPFDRQRRGTVLGEGAAAIVLESAESAARRAAPVYGKIVACASACQVGSSWQTDVEGALRQVLQRLISQEGKRRSTISFISAQGLGTRSGDRAEARAIAGVFGQANGAPPVVAAKAYLGHLGGASAVTELIAGLLALRAGELYPIRNFCHPDPECPVNVVRESGMPAGDAFIQLAYTPQAQAAGVLVARV